MLFTTCLVALLAGVAVASPSNPFARRSSASPPLATDITKIQKLWGEVSPYFDNAENYFGVKDTGLPDGCQVEQAHLLERHGSRFPTGGYEGLNDVRFGSKVFNWTTGVNGSEHFTGPLTFLNGYRYTMGSSLLVGLGASQKFQSGVSFWQRYGRILYNATAGELAYNASYMDGSARPKPVLRTTSQSRIENSEINWALGFFGPSYDAVANPKIENATTAFNVVIIPEGGTENNTLASYDSCLNADDDTIGYLGDINEEVFKHKYLMPATARLQKYCPPGFKLTTNDTYAMQDICAYETNYLGYSDFCSLFTMDEWNGFENVHDIEYYYDYSYGNPTGRAQGIGYLQELKARLEHQYILSSNTSVNSTIDNNAADFPLHQAFYADFSHDDILISVLTAMSLDYIKDAPSLTQVPPNPNRKFILSHLTPFGARLITEVIGCGSAKPTPQPTTRQYYTPGQYGYKAGKAPNKFIRIRLNNGILPLSTIRGGACGNRTDGMCTMGNFLKSQENADYLANYEYACFGNYTIGRNLLPAFDGKVGV